LSGDFKFRWATKVPVKQALNFTASLVDRILILQKYEVTRESRDCADKFAGKA
jgi:hypothetical protein